MEPEKKKVVMEFKWFEVEDPLTAPQDMANSQEKADPSVYAQFELNLERHEFEAAGAQQQDVNKRDNTKDVLMLFADKSGSMSGTPFNAMKKGMEDLADVIFPGEDPSNFPFKEVHTVFYGSSIFPKTAKDKQTGR